MRSDTLLAHEIWVRLTFFAAVFLLMAGSEAVLPRRPASTSTSRRWVSNLGILLVNTMLVRVLFPAGAVGIAWVARERGWGLLNQAELPGWVGIAASVMALDLVVYLQHVMFHAVPALWRLHMVHHADLDFDVTTGNRFHPLEILISMFVKAAAVVVLGPPVVAVLAFEVLLNATAMFNHANVRIPLALDRGLRWLVVTPDMHRVHHSASPIETNSNFGFNLPWWDRLLGTYRDQPRAGHEVMSIGLRHVRDPRRLNLAWSLALPFTADPGGYSLGRGARALDRQTAVEAR